MKFRLLLTTMAIVLPAMSNLFSAENNAAGAINSIGIELLQKTGEPGSNALLSPYSIQSALAMVYAGAEGDTRKQMAKALDFPDDSTALDSQFGALRKQLEALSKTPSNAPGNAGPAIALSIANRLYGQQGYDFHKEFLDLVKKDFGAPFEAVNFKDNAENARAGINRWVEDQTHQRITDLIPDKGVGADTRLVLVNAIYLKAQWDMPFMADSTQLRPFHPAKGEDFNVQTMGKQMPVGYSQYDDYSVITIPYANRDLQFLVLLPASADGLPKLEKALTSKMLADCAHAEQTMAVVYLPKFKLEPPPMELAKNLQALGMKSAFDVPQGSADFSRIATPKPGDYLSLSQVFHKTFFSLNENGTEAAAATAAVAVSAAAFGGPPIKLVEVHVDHPFLFAIQHVPTGTCLFLGRMNDPRP